MKRNKGFTLIELMVVVAIIAIIAAIAIPNLMRARISANEAVAVTVVKAYCTAQVIFRNQGHFNVGGGTRVNTSANMTYADNFRNLSYGVAAGTEADPVALDLISRAHADAFALSSNTTDGGIATVTSTIAVASGATAAAGARTAYQGYYFTSRLEELDFASDFAQMAIPVDIGSGSAAFWVGQQGSVWRRGIVAGDKVDDLADDGGYVDDSPSNVTEKNPAWVSN